MDLKIAKNDDMNSICIQQANKDSEILEDSKKLNIKKNYLDFEINSFSYEQTLKDDKRNFFQYYISLIKTKHILFVTFFSNDYNSKLIKICFFFYSFSLYYFVNALFFTDATMNKIYEDEGDFNFVYLLPQIIYSAFISSVINSLVKFLGFSENKIIEIKHEANYAEAIKKLQELKNVSKLNLFYFL